MAQSQGYMTMAGRERWTMNDERWTMNYEKSHVVHRTYNTYPISFGELGDIDEASVSIAER